MQARSDEAEAPAAEAPIAMTPGHVTACWTSSFLVSFLSTIAGASDRPTTSTRRRRLDARHTGPDTSSPWIATVTGIEGLVASATHRPPPQPTVLRDLRRRATAIVPRAPRHAGLLQPIHTCLRPAEPRAREADRPHTVAGRAALAEDTSGPKVILGGPVRGRRLAGTTHPGETIRPGVTTLLRDATTRLRAGPTLRGAITRRRDGTSHLAVKTTGGTLARARRCATMRTTDTTGAHPVP